MASVFLFLLLTYTVQREENEHIDQEVARNNRAIEDIFHAHLRTHAEKMGAVLALLADDPALQQAFIAGDRGELLRLTRPLFERLRGDYNITHFYFHDRERYNVLRVHQPERHGDLINRFTALNAERSGRTVYGIELGPLGTFTLRVVTPWYRDGELLGYLELGEEIERVLDQIIRHFDLDLAVVIDKSLLERKGWQEGMQMLGREPDWEQFPDVALVYHSFIHLPEAVAAYIARRNGSDSQAVIRAKMDERSYRLSFLTLQDAGERAVGEMAILYDMSERIEGAHLTVRTMAVAALFVGGLLIAMFYVLLGRAERQLILWQSRLTEESGARVAEKERHIEQLEHLALYDALTQLPNRKLLQSLLDERIAQARDAGQPFALIFLNLRHLREINDTLGHDIGDVVLQRVAERLRLSVRRDDLVARPGGDEFAVIIPNEDEHTALDKATTLHADFTEPLPVDGFTLNVDANIGVAVYPAHGQEAASLLQRADVAMRLAKSTRQGIALYDASRDPYSVERLNLIGELRTAIPAGQLCLHYQPEVMVSEPRVQRLEALVRWQHPRHGMISPEQFVHLAEYAGTIRPLTYWVLNEALRQCAEWEQMGLNFSVSVNISSMSLLDADFTSQVAGLLERHRLGPSRLTLEITESTFMHEPDRCLVVLHELHSMGIDLSIDDFGTGYSSLAYLKDLPVSELKIDKSFVLDMLEDINNAKIVASTIALAHKLGLSVVAEGVEHEEIWQALAEQQCDVIQGFLISRPLPPDELLAWFNSSQWEA